MLYKKPMLMQLNIVTTAGYKKIKLNLPNNLLRFLPFGGDRGGWITFNYAKRRTTQTTGLRISF